MTELPSDIEALKKLVQQLLEDVARLTAENIQLKAENAELKRRLGLNSGNSDKPPSSDGYQKKVSKPGIPKAGKKPSGGQPGHQGNTLKRVAQPDRIEIHVPPQCRCCGRTFSEAEAHETGQSRQVFDVPMPKLEVTEHRLAEVTCCGLLQTGSYPAEVTANIQYGAGVRALITKLSVEHRMPQEQISQLFGDLYGYDLNSATLEDALERAYHLTETVETQIIAQLQAAPCVHFDETGIRVAGKLNWLHTAATDTLTHLFVHKKRGAEALNAEASVLKDFSGIAIHDCWKPYFSFTSAQHVLCGAHLLRELQGLWESGSVWAEDMHGLLLMLYRMPRPVADDEQVRLHYRLILAQADAEEPQPNASKRGRPQQSKGRNLLNRLREYEAGVLAFALEPDIPFTNNQAERDLRPAKVKQKVSGCFRTQTGAAVYARLQATVATLRKQGLNVFASLHDLFLGKPIVLGCTG